jgi:hypothetical protein
MTETKTDMATAAAPAAGEESPEPRGVATLAPETPATEARAAEAPAAEAPAAEAHPAEAPAAEARAATPAANAHETELFDTGAADELRTRWQAIQVAFVDEPRGAVEQADKLVDEVLKQLADSFTRERGELERAWSGGSEASTEDLRQAIRRYRSFFNRLLAI